MKDIRDVKFVFFYVTWRLCCYTHKLLYFIDYGANFEKTETLEEYVGSSKSPWHLDYSWSQEAKELRELAVKSPWLIDDKFVLGYFKTLRIVNKNVSQWGLMFCKSVN